MVDLAVADLNEHSKLLAHKLRDTHWVMRYLRRGVRTRISVSEGLAAGASGDFRLKSAVVGSDMIDDILLLDEQIEPQHAILKFKSSIFGPIMSVEAREDGVRVGAELQAAGTSSSYTLLPQKVRIQGAELQIDPPPAIYRSISIAKVGIWRSAQFGAALIALFLLLNMLVFFPTAKYDLSLRPIQPGSVVEQAALPLPRDPDIEPVELAKSMLANLGISETLVVTEDNYGAITVSGTLRDYEAEAWAKFRRWCDYVHMPTIVDQVSIVQANVDLPPISSVYLGEQKFISLSNGVRIGVGGILPSGLTIVEIDRQSVSYTRAGESSPIQIKTGF